MASVLTCLFTACLAVWTAFSLLRFVHMYDRTSLLQRWRRWDWLHLVPVGAFFSPRVPPTELWIVVRDFLPDGRVTRWRESPRIRPRAWWHTFWNPDKHIWKGKAEAARALLTATGNGPEEGTRLPMTFLLSEPYLALLRYVSGLPRLSKPRATQFAVLETDILTREVVRSVLSCVHEV
jgi:hypothetical protein